MDSISIDRMVFEISGLTPHQARTLRAVSEEGTPRLSAVAERLRVTPRSVTEVVDALEAAGLVERSPDVDDRRAVRVSLTEEGIRTLAAVDLAQDRDVTTLFGRLTDHGRASLSRILLKLLSE